MSKFIDLTDRKFGILSVVGRDSDCTEGLKNCIWLCKCDCGNYVFATGRDLRRGHKKSCGCLKVKHGLSQTSEYNSYQKMLNRCYNPGFDKYKYYGARGIKVCKRWREDFNAFLADMGVKPFPDCTLDGIDVNKDYSPENCRWADKYTQARNKRVQSRSKTGVTGVTIGNNGFVASLRYKGHLNHLGTFKRLEDAVSARKAAELKYWGKKNELHSS